MKRITFLLFTALLSLTAIAQVKTVVTPPEGLQTESWMLTAQRYDASDYTVDAFLSVNIGFDGQDVYVQGLNMYLPDTWVKGTRNGNLLTFAANQYYGEMSDYEGTAYDTYFAGCDLSWFDGVTGLQPIDVTFTINETGTSWTTNTVLVVNTELDAIAGFDYLKDVVIAKAVEGAATPKAPSIYLFQPFNTTEGYGGISLTFPPVDVDGNPLQTDKLSYVLYKDVEHEQSVITIPALDEDAQDYIDMTEIPYDFTDDYNIEAKGNAAYFYEPSSSWNRVGVKAIYRGGDEERESEITWMLLKPYADESTVFDFNAMDAETTPYSTSSSGAGDITTDKVLKVDNVTLTISPCEGGNTPNRYWLDYNLQALQLRMYGGTLTFDVPDNFTIEGIWFYTDEWNDETWFDCGECEDGVWTGSAQHVVANIADFKPNTKINSIAVVVKDGATGISTKKILSSAGSWYTLQGVKLDSTPTQKGLYIHNGRVRVVK